MVRKDISDYVNKVYLMIMGRIKKLGLSLGICFFLQGVKSVISYQLSVISYQLSVSQAGALGDALTATNA